MVELICPSCATTTHLGGVAECPVCSACGRPLTESNSRLPQDGLGDDESLALELRLAFSDFPDASSFDYSKSSIGSPTRVRAIRRFDPASLLLPGTRLGDFELIELIGRGGMGSVYRACQTSLGREVAVKLLPCGVGRSDSRSRRFQVEAKAIARLDHPNVLPIYAHGEQDGFRFYAMPFIQGWSLNELIDGQPERCNAIGVLTKDAPTGLDSLFKVQRKGGPEVAAPRAAIPIAEKRPRTVGDFRTLARMMASACDGLAHAHEQGVVHRDIKPHNLLLSRDGKLFVTDFGLSQIAGDPQLTVTGEVMGTPAYLSPEQARGDTKQIDHRTDIFSMGVTLYELLARHRPFEGATRAEILHAICAQETPSLRRADRTVPVDLETICQRAMAKEPSRRYPTARAMAEDLKRFSQGLPICGRRVGPWERVTSWTVRRKAVAVSVFSLVAAFILGITLVLTVMESRGRQGTQLLREAYDQLVFTNYKEPSVVRGKINEGLQLGANVTLSGLVQALLDFDVSSPSKHRDAIARLDTVLNKSPKNVEAIYLKAWAYDRAQEKQNSVKALELANSLGGPKTAAEWFFKGLALHRDRPTEAMECYRQANALRAGEQLFFPQAVLHLARACNQIMYATRSLEPYQEAQSTLQSLVNQGHYGAYPYYLLSLTNRIAAEIYRDGMQDPAQSHQYFEQALAWAQEAQVLYPNDERSVTAEAEYWESLEHWEEAWNVRTRALGIVSDQQRTARCEQYHFRWRLGYWLGRYDDALADLAALADCEKDDRTFTKYVYPALVYADRGDRQSALDLARTLHDPETANPQTVIWKATLLRLLGEPDEAQDFLDQNAEQVDFSIGLEWPQTAEWNQALYALCRQERDLDSLLTLAVSGEAARKLRAEAYFHAAVLDLSVGDRESALQNLQTANNCFAGALDFSFHARLFSVRMQSDPGWPAWLGPSQ